MYFHCFFCPKEDSEFIILCSVALNADTSKCGGFQRWELVYVVAFIAF